MNWVAHLPYVKGFIGAIVGAILCGLCWIAYVDHARVTFIWNALQTAQAQPKK